ncbi:hypothetical protein [Streptomyces sp. NPDC021212]|uniref:hypothetical protein n=1 Tax=Streptomyces sp. NPDC021212 TaxID=3365118 RepID=UPI003795F157
MDRRGAGRRAGRGTGCTPDDIAAVSKDTGAPAPGAAGIGDTLHPGLGNGGYAVRHYAWRSATPKT